tara:strand:+ start:649 stop:993 length:345 start_codon:yes stop_codon:yes gene_type:complete
MKKYSFFIIFLFSMFFLSACVQMRDYVGEREGAYGLMRKKTFGEGEEVKKDYYVINDGDGLVIGDTKNEVIKKIGLPDEVKTTLEGYETWVYPQRGDIFYFSGDRLNRWDELTE